MGEPIFFKPVFHDRIWGGTALKDVFNYEISSELVGECWGISAHPNGPSAIEKGSFSTKTLDELWKQYPEIFNYLERDRFPLLVKILDANEDLSVQVHPGNEYASTFEQGEMGKTECWYILDCKEGAEIIYGHHAATKEEFAKMITKGQWDQLLKKVKVKPGDFFYVPSGTIHALGKGILVLEIQQNSDTTYRIYDYDRIDKNGNKRELHLEKALDVTNVPHTDFNHSISVTRDKNITITTFIQSQYFSVHKWAVNGEVSRLITDPFLLCSIISGEGKLVYRDREYLFQKGSHFMLPALIHEVDIIGKCEIMVCHP